MYAEIEFKVPTYFIGRNGCYDQKGLDVQTSDSIRDTKGGEMQSGVLLQPIGNRGIANCTISIPLASIGAVITALKAARKDLRTDARGKANKASAPATAEAEASDLVGQHTDEAGAVRVSDARPEPVGQ